MVPSAPVTPEVVETPVVATPAAEVAAAPVAAEAAAVPSAEVAVTAQAEAPECLITAADSTSPSAVAIAGFAILGVVVKLFLGNKKKKAAL
jgi:hypothetical protein